MTATRVAASGRILLGFLVVRGGRWEMEAQSGANVTASSEQPKTRSEESFEGLEKQRLVA